jgi:hypothetical protein
MNAWITCAFLLVMLALAVPYLPPFFYLAAAVAAFFIGNGQLREAKQISASSPSDYSQVPLVNLPNHPSIEPMGVQLPERKMPDNNPADLRCPACGASIKPIDKVCAFCGTALKPLIELPEPASLGGLEIGKSVQINHPIKGQQVYQVRGRLLFAELWQASRDPGVPWTPTGNYFAGFALEPEEYLLSWKNRFFLLEEHRSPTDMEINRDFIPYAREFGRSDQTAKIGFSEGGTHWTMMDIGRYSIEFEEGEGLHFHKGAVGRFIHASSGNRALVLDDFQSGGSGGQDTLWKGFLVQETDITF